MWVRVQARALVAKPLCSGVTRGVGAGRKVKNFFTFFIQPINLHSFYLFNHENNS